MKRKLEMLVAGIGLAMSGFFGGQLMGLETSTNLPAEDRVEIPIIVLDSLEGDELQIEVFGPARVVWAEDKTIEQEGVQKIPLGQLPNAEDLKFRNFSYVGNAKTGKFYPASSYPARGTAVRDRRFFQTKQAALSAGFIATKLVK